MTVLAEDVAPFVRAIVSHDLAREQQRARMEEVLLSGERGNKRLRTTRASRAAFDGSQRTSARRERWLPKGVDYEKILRTGGSTWAGLLNASSGLSDIDELSAEYDCSGGVSVASSAG